MAQVHSLIYIGEYFWYNTLCEIYLSWCACTGSSSVTRRISQYLLATARQNCDILQLVTLINPFRQTMIDPRYIFCSTVKN
jgi:hypothetical protein